MPIISNNPNYRKKFDAFRIIDQSGHEPLKEAIACALRLRQAEDSVSNALDGQIEPETRAQLTLALARCLPEEFYAWIKICEFVYAKQRQMELSGSIELTTRLAEDIRDARQRLINATLGN